MHLLLIQSVAVARPQVGVKVNSDAARLARDYKVNVANTVDVATHASKCWVETSSRSLAGMVSSLLGKELPKDPTVRLSSWSSALNNEQVLFRIPERVLLVLVFCFRALFIMCLIGDSILLSLLVGCVLIISTL